VRKGTHSLAGVWKLVAFDMEYQDTGERKATYGAKPRGYLVLLPEGRMMAVITAEGRKVPETDDERSVAFRTMLAYSGMYRLEGDKWITKVDVAWNEAWTGTDQTRSFTFDGKQLVVSTAWQPSANELGRTIRGTLTWEREK
jgi:Lipocalin-like domain